MKTSLLEKYSFIKHLLLWLGAWLFFIVFFSYNSHNLYYNLTFSTILLLITAITTYTVAYYLIPKYLWEKKYILFGVYTFSTMLFTTFCTILLLMLSITYIPGIRKGNLPPLSKNYIFILLLVYLIVAIASYMVLWKKNIQTKEKNKELELKLLQTSFYAKEQELEYLKSQIHPHFLFNTLNTIYGFALKQSKDTPVIILKLSNLLDYILYEINKPTVKLQNEINHIKNYIDLEKMRFQKTLRISFNIELNDQDIDIAPMLLLPFVENAFKHGTPVNGFLYIKVKVVIIENLLHFSIINSHNQHTIKSGIGIDNIKKRLEMIYPKNYELTINSDSQWFTSDLKLIFKPANL